MEPIALPVVHGDIVPEDLGAGVGTAGVKGRGFVLRRLGRSEHFNGGGLVEAAIQADAMDGFQEAEDAEAGHVDGVARDLEGNLDVALCSQVVDLVRAYGV